MKVKNVKEAGVEATKQAEVMSMVKKEMTQKGEKGSATCWVGFWGQFWGTLCSGYLCSLEA